MNLRQGLGAVVLLLVELVACSPVSQPTQQPTLQPTLPPTQASSPTLTPTVVWFPPSSTPALQDTRPLETFTPAPTFSAGEVILQDNFSDRKQWQTGQSPEGTIAYGINELTLADAGHFFQDLTASMT